MILGKQSIQDALSSRNVKVLRSDGNGKTEELTFENFNNKASGTHKIALHVGFLVKTLSHRKFDTKILYKSLDGIVDLRKTQDNKYTLQPHESVVIYTREYVALKQGFFGILLPKVNLFRNGLTTTMSYIDPGWKGILELVVSNNSEDTIEIQSDQPISNLILLEIEKGGDYKNVNSHFDCDWNSPNIRTWQPWPERKASSGIGITKIIDNVKRFNLASWIVFIPLITILLVKAAAMAVKFKIPLPSESIASSIFGRIQISFESGVLALLFRSHFVDAVVFWLAVFAYYKYGPITI